MASPDSNTVDHPINPTENTNPDSENASSLAARGRHPATTRTANRVAAATPPPTATRAINAQFRESRVDIA